MALVAPAKPMMPSAAVARPAIIGRLPASERTKATLRRRRICARIEGCEFVANAADQAFPAFGCGGALRHDADLLDDAGAGKFVRYGDERNFRRLQNVDGL